MTLAQARNLLEKERARIRGRLGLSPAPTSLPGPGDDADEVAAASERIVVFATREQLAAQLRAVDDALDRIAEGRFGLCLTCEQSIPAPRLRANPSAARCIRCEQAREEQARALPERFRMGEPDAEPRRRKRTPEEDLEC